jgi:DNA-directed RNA polymerase specialized sigma24 family protein
MIGPVGRVDLVGVYLKPKAQVRALEALLRRLPEPTAPTRQSPDRRQLRHGRRLSESDVQELVQGYGEGITVVELAKRFGIGKQTVHKILRRRGMPTRLVGLDPKQVDEAVMLYRAGWTLAKIGQRMKVSPETVRRRLLERGVQIRPKGAR